MSVDQLPELRSDDPRLAEIFAVRRSLDGWTVEEYEKLSGRVSRVEYVEGRLELLVAASIRHQRIVTAILSVLFDAILKPGHGEVFGQNTGLATRPRHFREPDVTVVLSEHAGRLSEQRALYADLVVEVISPDDRRRDLITKRDEYAAAGIPEYWIADPDDGSLTILVLEGGAYREAIKATAGTVASATLDGVEVDIDETIGQFLN
ncbi:MAG: Uma2 family endonuclease [Planctomycetota bacterium]